MGSEWGRVDADGTVYVRTADGERPIGSWHAGDAEAGLAYYARRYDDLATEIALLEQRLESGAGDPRATVTQATALRAGLDTVSAVGDLAVLEGRLAALVGSAEERIAAQQAAREQARVDAIAAKEALVLEAEKIAEIGTSWKASGDRLRAIVEEWKQIKGIDRKTDDALWKRFAAARDAFGKRRGQHFAQLDAERASARAVKQALVERAEELARSSDWKSAATALRSLMAEWKAAPRGARDTENALWVRFRAAQDAFYARRGEVFGERDAAQLANLRAKEDLIASAERIDVSDPKAAQAQLRGLLERYDSVGQIPRDAMRRTDERMTAAQQRVRDAADTERRRTAAHSNPFLIQLRARLSEAEAKLARARNSGDRQRIARAEAEVSERRALIPDAE
jgi:Domain of Unknown Function (DUF349)